MRKLPKPTDAELGILRVLWTRGPSTVRQVHDTLNEERPTGYTTALKLLQIMGSAIRRAHHHHHRAFSLAGGAVRKIAR